MDVDRLMVRQIDNKKNTKILRLMDNKIDIENNIDRE